MHNNNFIDECIESRKRLVKSKEFKRFQKSYILKMLLKHTIAIVLVVSLYFIMSITESNIADSDIASLILISLIILMIVALILFILAIVKVLYALLLLIGLKKIPTLKYFKSTGELEKRDWYETSSIYNSNIVDIDALRKLEYPCIRIVYDDTNSFLCNPAGTILTDEPIKSVQIDDRSYNELVGSGRKTRNRRVRQVYTKVVFADGKFITFLNISDEFSRKFEQLML